MPIYHKLGEIPKKRHTIFKSKNGNYYYEQLFGTEGFIGMDSLLYHTHRPTQVKEILKSYKVKTILGFVEQILLLPDMKALLYQG
jgi:homogentisate 1,2-dioxygenase